MSKTNKLRFHLAKGKNYMKWQYRKADGKTVTYFPTENFYGVIRGKLHNNRKVANAIHGGANKNVCAWISSEQGLAAANDQYLMESERGFMVSGDYLRVSYNPKDKPYWIVAGMDIDIDGYNGLFFIFEKRIYVSLDHINLWLREQKGINFC